MLSRALGEGDDDLLELVGLGLVLGVVDDDELAARLQQAVVAGLRLGLRLRVGDDDAAGSWAAGRRRDRVDRLVVVLLAEQQDLELRLRVVERVDVVR